MGARPVLHQPKVRQVRHLLKFLELLPYVYWNRLKIVIKFLLIIFFSVTFSLKCFWSLIIAIEYLFQKPLCWLLLKLVPILKRRGHKQFLRLSVWNLEIRADEKRSLRRSNRFVHHFECLFYSHQEVVRLDMRPQISGRPTDLLNHGFRPHLRSRALVENLIFYECS